MDLEFIFLSIISLCMSNWKKWTKLFKNLLALVVVYSVFILTAIAFILLHISCVRRKRCFAYIPLLHHACITSLTLLQLHHHKSLIKLTLLQLHHHMFLIKLTSITSLHLNYKSCSKLTLHHSRIPPYSPEIIHLQIQVFNFCIYHPPLFHSFINLFPLPSQTTSGILWNYCFLPSMSRLIQDHNQLIKTQVFAPYALIKLIKVFNKIWHLTCFNANCNAWCHQACNGLSTNQTRHTKICGCSIITWECPQHGTGIVKIFTPPPPVYELPSCPATGKPWSLCKNPICSFYDNLAYHCANPSCNNFSHLAAICSGFVNPRGITRALIISTRIWHCHLHPSPLASGHPSTQLDTSPSRSTLPSLKSLLNQGMSLAYAKSSKEKCAKCFTALTLSW